MMQCSLMTHRWLGALTEWWQPASYTKLYKIASVSDTFGFWMNLKRRGMEPEYLIQLKICKSYYNNSKMLLLIWDYENNICLSVMSLEQTEKNKKINHEHCHQADIMLLVCVVSLCTSRFQSGVLYILPAFLVNRWWPCPLAISNFSKASLW